MQSLLILVVIWMYSLIGLILYARPTHSQLWAGGSLLLFAGLAEVAYRVFLQAFVSTEPPAKKPQAWQPHQIYLDGQVWVEASPDEIKRQNQGLPPRNRR